MNSKAGLILCSLSAVCLIAAQEIEQCFRQLTNGSLCIRSAFTRNLSGITSDLPCSLHCGSDQRCQAFTTADGLCQLFVFDRCSKSVRDCSCSRRGRLFVKRQPGLSAGSLCPPGYGDELCGVKYRVLKNNATWAVQRGRCESEPGLVIMADVADAAELSHVNVLFVAHSPTYPMYLGGYRVFPGAQVTDGWFWVGCNITIGSVWGTGEPSGFSEMATARYPTVTNVVDITDMGLFGALCECVSPFD